MKLEDIKDHFKAILDDEQEVRAEWLDDLKFGMADDQWPESLKRMRENDPDGARPCLTVNKIPVHARQIINDMRQSRAAIKILPVDDKADPDTAEILQGMVRHIEHVSNAGMAYDIAAEYQVFMGMGYFRIDTIEVDALYNYQDLIIRPIRNPFSVYFDPWVEDHAGADAKRCFVTESMTEEAFKAEFPKADKIDWDLQGTGDTWVQDKRIRVAEHFWIEQKDVDYVNVNGDWMKASKFEKSGIDAFVEGVTSIQEPQLMWQKLNGQEILEGGSEGMEKLGKYIPIVRVPGEDYWVDDKRIVHGIVRRSKDAQRLYNYSVSVNAETNALQPKAPWIVAEEALDGHETEWAQSNIKNYAYLPYNAMSEDGQPLPPPARQFPAGVNNGFVSMLQMADGDLQATIGQFAASLGQPSNEKSGIAIQSRQRVGDIATYHYPDNMSHAVRHAGRILVDLIPHIYDTDRIARTLGEDGTAEVVQLSTTQSGEMQDAAGKITNIYNLSVGKYDVAVSTGPSYNTKRQDAFESMAQMTQANPNLWGVIGDLLVKNMDWPGADEMAKRMRATIPPEILQDDENGESDPQMQMQQMQQQMQQMQEQHQQLQEQAQQLAEENEQMNGVINGKMIEKEIKEMEAQLKKYDIDSKSEAANIKNQLDQSKLGLDAQQLELQRFEAEAQARLGMDSAGIQANGNDMMLQQMQQMQAALAQSTEQYGAMLAATLAEIAKPREMTIETDENGDIIGGVSAPLN
tara:strand:- start:8931 stop:11165 length:2235 start_codon:yes stop_codon:yes gene_type:complete